MDYANRRRLKLLGHLRMEDSRGIITPELEQVSLGDYRAKVERVAIIEVVAFDWNCPQHITPRYTDKQFAELVSQGAEGDSHE